MANMFYATVRDCRSCARNWLHGKRQRSLKLLGPAGPLDLLGMDSLDPLPKIRHGNQFVPVMSDWYTEL